MTFKVFELEEGSVSLSTSSGETPGFATSTKFESFTSFLPDDEWQVERAAQCDGWTAKRVFLEMFLALVLLGNIFSAYIIVTTTRRRGSPFIINCIGMISVSNIFLTLQLLFYPFAFSWTEEDSSVEGATEIDVMETSFAYFPDSSLQTESSHLHPCKQAGNVTCRVSGFLFGIFLFSPLVTITVMTIDTTMATFKWKMYRFRPHTASAIRLTLFIGFMFAIVASFGLPALGLGTHYHYHNLFKICWISVHSEDYVVQGFVYFIFGFGSFLVLLVLISGYLVFRASRSQKVPYKQAIGHQCSLIFGQFHIMKSRSWTSYARLIVCLDVLAFLTYLPLTVGYIIKFGLLLDDIYWLNLLTEIAALLVPSASPFIYIGLYKSHRKRVAEIFLGCSGPESKSSRVSPISISTCSSDSSFPDVECSGSWMDEDMMLEEYDDYVYDRARNQNRIRVIDAFEKVKAINRFDRLSQPKRADSDAESHFNTRQGMQTDVSRHRINPIYTGEYDVNSQLSPHNARDVTRARKLEYRKQLRTDRPTVHREPSLTQMVWRYARNIASPLVDRNKSSISDQTVQNLNRRREFQRRPGRETLKRNVTFAPDVDLRRGSGQQDGSNKVLQSYRDQQYYNFRPTGDRHYLANRFGPTNNSIFQPRDFDGRRNYPSIRNDTPDQMEEYSPHTSVPRRYLEPFATGTFTRPTGDHSQTDDSRTPEYQVEQTYGYRGSPGTDVSGRYNSLRRQNR